MNSKTILGLYLWFVVTCLAFADEPFLAERPTGLKACKQSDPNFRKCFAKDFEFLNTEWKDGIPGLTNVGGFDPMHVDRITIVEDNNNPVAQLNVELLDVNVRGISKFKVIDASFDPKKLITKLTCVGQKLNINSKYDMKGRILAIPLNGNGQSTMKIENVELTLTMRLKIRQEFGHTFTDIDKFRLEIEKVGNFHINMENLFNGNPELTEGTNTIINENWPIFYEALGPAITRGLEEPMKLRFKTIFAYVPAKYIIEDL